MVKEIINLIVRMLYPKSRRNHIAPDIYAQTNPPPKTEEIDDEKGYLSYLGRNACGLHFDLGLQDKYNPGSSSWLWAAVLVVGRRGI
jgi:hypothetical protein